MLQRFRGVISITFLLFLGLSGFAAEPVLAQESFAIRDGGDDPNPWGIDDRYKIPDGGARKCEVKVDDIVWGAGAADPGATGPYTTSILEYNWGPDSANLPDFDDPVEMAAEIVYPNELDCGPFPIVFMMHGRHATCYDPGSDNFSVSQDWPCEPGELPLPSYQGYRYFAEILASHGIIAVSISANGINAGFGADGDARAQLFQRHMELWEQFATQGGFSGIFVGRVDLDRIGTMGHSRGGGAVAIHRALNAAEGSPFGLKAALMIAPVDTGEEFHSMTDVALGVVLPYCDGDVDNLAGVNYYDGSRYSVLGDTGSRHTFLVLGANHAYYNSAWDDNLTNIQAQDDWDKKFGAIDGPYCQPNTMGNGRLNSLEQQGTLIATGSAFFRTYLQDRKDFLPFLRSETLPPPSAQTDDIHVAYHPADLPETRLDVSRMTQPDEDTFNSLMGLVVPSNLFRFEYCDPTSGAAPASCLTNLPANFWNEGQMPHDTGDSPVSMLRVAWKSGAFTTRSLTLGTPSFETELPAGYGDVSGYRALQFRAFVDFTDPLNPFLQPQNLRIVLEDGAGLTQSVVVGDHSANLYYPPSLIDQGDGDSPVPRAVLNTVRVPLSAFDGVFLNDIRFIQFVFDQTPSGAINIADIAFADEAANLTPVVSSSLVVTELTANGDKLFEVGLDVAVEDDKDAGLPATVLVYSDEDDLDSQMNQSSPDAKDIAPGSLRLRGEQDNNGDGRVYLILAKAADSAGALGFDCQTVVVPAGNGADDLAAVQAEASAAAGDCSSFAAASEGLVALPAGFFLVGDGPILGQEQ